VPKGRAWNEVGGRIRPGADEGALISLKKERRGNEPSAGKKRGKRRRGGKLETGEMREEEESNAKRYL